MVYLKNRKINPIPSVVIFTVVVFASVLRPSGEVFFYLFILPVTRDSLNAGVSRALLLTGLVYISRFSVSSALPVPGRAGKLLGTVFFFFNRITSFKWRDYLKKGSRLSPIQIFTRFFDDLLFISDLEEESGYGKKSADPETAAVPLVIVMSLIIIAGYTLSILYFLKYL